MKPPSILLRLAAEAHGLATAWETVRKLFEFGEWVIAHLGYVAVVAIVAGVLLYLALRRSETPASDPSPVRYEIRHRSGAWTFQAKSGQILARFTRKPATVHFGLTYLRKRKMPATLVIYQRNGREEVALTHTPRGPEA